jgi:hypothetical protein
LNKLLLKATPLITAALLLTLFVAPVFATGAHLWFYSVDPATLPDWTGTIDGSVNPQDDDPNYVGADPDPWLTESVVMLEGDWETPFSIWLGNADPQDTSYTTIVIISFNDAAAAAIDDMSVQSPGYGTGFDIMPSDPADFPLPPHGVSNDADWYGFMWAQVGDLASGSYVKIDIDIHLYPGADVSEAKIHFDAIGWSTEQHSTDFTTADITSPFSHDYTFIVPEPATIALAASSLIALGAYAYKRKKQ